MKTTLALKAVLAVILTAGLMLHAQPTTAPQALFDQYSKNLADRELQRQMVAHWLSILTRGQQVEVIEQTSRALVLANDPTHRQDIRFARARAAILLPAAQTTVAGAFVEEFIQNAVPQDDRSSELLFRLARVQPDNGKLASLHQRNADQYPTTYWGIMSKGAIHQLAGIGKPFDLDFTDAVTGKAVSVQRDMKGKVVVVYFWATWCTDCAAELPKMKQLYEAYKDRGVEFIGVSLDEPESAGGLTQLRTYVARNAIPWPQLFQGGERFRSDFSAKWGVNSTPTVFVLDKQGQLYSTNAKGQLETLIPEVLARPTG